MKKYLLLFFLLVSDLVLGQGFNHSWLIGTDQTVIDTFVTSPKARILFDLTSDTVIGEVRKMAFSETQATISDASGNFLFASNGCWIMDATGDTMLNGKGLNPGAFANSYCTNTTGLPMPGANLIIPFPGDSNKYVLFHQVGNFNFNLLSTEVYYTVVDMTLNGGLGGVVANQKNIVAFQGYLSWGLAACKHANGRDWWILAEEDASDTIYKVLFTPNGVSSVATQVVNMPIPSYDNAGEPTFSPDGTKFAYTSAYGGGGGYYDTRLFSFDRCTGMLDSLDYTIHYNGMGFGIAFSSNSKYLYSSSFGKIYQLDTDAPNINSTDTLVAAFDGYCYPCQTCCTDFWLMYLAANGKIYITSGNYTIDLGIINFPDSADTACNVQQHSLRLPCYTIRGGINHPNYYLGAITGSVCDSLGLGISEDNFDFKFKVFPNPVTENYLKIIYLLPQNQKGLFEITDINNRKIFSYTLPPWSTLQTISIPNLAGGVYVARIKSGNYSVAKKLVVIR
jgi:hypothetical protein